MGSKARAVLAAAALWISSAADNCPETCNGFTCDFWLDETVWDDGWAISCEENEYIYGCDCDGCECGGSSHLIEGEGNLVRATRRAHGCSPIGCLCLSPPPVVQAT